MDAPVAEEEDEPVVAAELSEALQRARPWVGFVAAAGSAAAVYALVLGGWELSTRGRQLDGAVMAGATLGLVALFPLLSLMRFTRSIDRLGESGRQADLTEALEHQGAFFGMLAVTLGVLLALAALWSFG